VWSRYSSWLHRLLWYSLVMNRICDISRPNKTWEQFHDTANSLVHDNCPPIDCQWSEDTSFGTTISDPMESQRGKCWMPISGFYPRIFLQELLQTA
jgi:hypothetical protein